MQMTFINYLLIMTTIKKIIKGGIYMAETILIVGFLVSPIILLILFLICALKISSMCSRIEELEDMQEIMLGDDNE